METKKFVAVLNKKVETGKVMNALAHMTVGLVSSYPNYGICLFGEKSDLDELTKKFSLWV